MTNQKSQSTLLMKYEHSSTHQDFAFGLRNPHSERAQAAQDVSFIRRMDGKVSVIVRYADFDSFFMVEQSDSEERTKMYKDGGWVSCEPYYRNVTCDIFGRLQAHETYVVESAPPEVQNKQVTVGDVIDALSKYDRDNPFTLSVFKYSEQLVGFAGDLSEAIAVIPDGKGGMFVTLDYSYTEVVYDAEDYDPGCGDQTKDGSSTDTPA